MAVPHSLTAMSLRCMSAAAVQSGSGGPPSVARLRGRYQWWKQPVYVAPHVNPLEVGPDFSVIEGRTIHVTSREQLKQKFEQIRLAKKAVQLLGEIKEMEEAHARAEARRSLESKQAELLRPKAKGIASIE
ncbi:unnamed protein product [Cylicocyclus nassatus]|uniref:39S ribosomal protein L52, mitochondrial n=1 Tax=Cylicocyclus nassatus TaxID=53992 RepID=A0AA36GKJ9_CYLNA|nr:unnamed protein product [Cylicocyclus nassatus]